MALRPHTLWLRKNAWKVQLGFIAAAIATYALVRGTRLGPSVYNLASISACLGFLAGPILHRSRALHWWLFAAAMGAFAIADGLWQGYVLAGSDLPYPSIGDAFYLAAYPLFFLGVLSLMRGSRPRRGDVLDGLIVGTAGSILVWELLVEPTARQGDASLLTRLVSAAYPSMDILLVVGIATLLLSGRFRNPSFLVLLAGFCLTFAADLAYAVLTLKGEYVAGEWMDFGWMVSYGLLGVAALHPSVRELATPPPERPATLGLKRLSVLGAALVTAPALGLAYELRGDRGLELELTVTTLAAVGLVLARVSVLWRERLGAEAELRESKSRYRALFDVAEAARERLERQNEELLELDRLKDEFVALVSHELRTPLTSIRGYVELLNEDLPGLDLDQQRNFLRVVERNADRLMTLVNDLLFMAQLEAKKLELDLEDVPLVALAEECAETARPVADERQIELVVASSGSPVLRADAVRVGQVLDNLLSNALKFTPPLGRVEIRVRAAGATARVEIADTGTGIGPADLKHLFSPFFRTSTATNAAVPGTGLGLAISKGIVEAHGGRIFVESREGHGTTVAFELPQSAPAALPHPAEALSR
jgi:signal transduction histidine kinase